MAQQNKEQKDQQEQQTARGYTIRQVTQMQPSWSEAERGEDGKFFVQLILDNGVDEYVLQPSSDDVDVILGMFEKSKHTIWDDQRKILIFDNIKAS